MQGCLPSNTFNDIKTGSTNVYKVGTSIPKFVPLYDGSNNSHFGEQLLMMIAMQ
jgi:hypothetical protein